MLPSERPPPEELTVNPAQTSVLCRPAQDIDSGSLESDDPQTIGIYKILEPIGEGGMGIVYLAEQSEPIRRKVAIKVIKPGMDSRQVIARFEAERQALAMMNHPNIAKVLDAGTTLSGRPYFVMELVRGIPITDYCDLANMNLRGRLSLFQSACGAVQHAHNKGIIHRDLKPSNVLVTEEDGEPIVKVIDFGVAKALTVTLTDKTLFTGLFQIIGTPSYMSPEQASLSNLDTDTRSDVYSLGVMLYELISGTLPIDREEVKAMSIDQLRRHICDTEPPRPSKRLGTVKERWERIATTHGIGVNEIPLLIDNELDWIVMRAIEKERRRRYQSASELAEDVRRHVDGETVTACPPTLLYRSRKFASRYQSLLVTSLIVLCVFACATIVSVRQAIKASQATLLAEHNERLAKVKSNALSEVLYANDMVAASQYFLAGDQERVNQILRRHERDDDDGTRGFEWYFVKTLKPVTTDNMHEAQDAINDLVLTSDGRHFLIADASGNLSWIDIARGRSLGTVKAEQTIIHDLEISPDDQVFTCGKSGNVWWFRWDQKGQRLVPVKQIPVCDGSLSSLAVSDDARTLWTGSRDGCVYEIDVASGQQQLVFDFKRRENSPVRDLELAVGNEILVAQGAELICLDLSQRDVNGLAVRRWMHAPDRVMGNLRDIELGANRQMIAAGQLYGLVTLFREAMPRPEVEFSRLMPADIHSVAISPDGKWLAAGDSVGVIHLLSTEASRRVEAWDSSATRKRGVKSWKAHEGKVRQLAFFASGQRDGALRIVSVSRDQRLVVSDPFSSSPTRYTSASERAPRDAPPAVANALLWADQVLGADLLTPGQWQRINQVVTVGSTLDCSELGESEQVGLMVDQHTLLRMAKRLQTSAPEVLWSAPAGSFAAGHAIAPDANWFAICVQQAQPRRHQIEIYRSGESVPRHVIESNLAYDMTFSPDGLCLAYTYNDDIVILDVAGGNPLHVLRHHIDSIYDLEYSPDGSRLGSVSGDRTLAVWDASSGRLLWSERAHENRSYALTFHPKLSTIATVGADSVVRFWSTREQISDDANRLVGEFPLDVGAGHQVRFDASGQSLFVRHGDIGVTALRGRFDAAD